MKIVEKESVERVQEAKITTIPGLNLESDMAILILDTLKQDRKLLKAVEPYGIDIYTGGNPNTIFSGLYQEIKKSNIITIQLLKDLIPKLKNKSFQRQMWEVVGLNSESTVLDLVSKILAKAIIFELDENPNTNIFVKQSNKLRSAADSFSANRGANKLGVMMKNKRDESVQEGKYRENRGIIEITEEITFDHPEIKGKKIILEKGDKIQMVKEKKQTIKEESGDTGYWLEQKEGKKIGFRFQNNLIVFNLTGTVLWDRNKSMHYILSSKGDTFYIHSITKRDAKSEVMDSDESSILIKGNDGNTEMFMRVIK